MFNMKIVFLDEEGGELTVKSFYEAAEKSTFNCLFFTFE